VPRELRRAQIAGFDLDFEKISFFVGRANVKVERAVKSTARRGMARWREHLYAFFSRMATRPTDFFRLPPDQVVELGAEVEI
jgi:KUP system potassium uptake protein